MKLCLSCHHSFDADSWRCPACGYAPVQSKAAILSFTQPEEGSGFRSEFFQDLAKLEAGHFWFQGRNQLISYALSRYFPKAQSFLEIGCGTGFVLAEVSRRFPLMRLSGGEHFTAGLPFAAARVPVAKLYQVDARQIPFVDEFDVIGAFDVLEHIPDDVAAMASIAGALRPGGGVIFTVPQHPWLWSATDDYACHERRYSRREMLDKLEAASLQVEFATSFVSLLLPVMMISRWFKCQAAEKDPLAELRLHPLLNHFFSLLMTIERQLIKLGIRLPCGGSLLIVAKKR